MSPELPVWEQICRRPCRRWRDSTRLNRSLGSPHARVKHRSTDLPLMPLSRAASYLCFNKNRERNSKTKWKRLKRPLPIGTDTRPVVPSDEEWIMNMQLKLGVIAVCVLLMATPLYAASRGGQGLTIPAGTVVPVRMID